MRCSRTVRGSVARLLPVGLCCAALFLTACSEDSGSAAEDEGEHVLKGHADALDKARDVGRQLEEGAARKDAASQ